MTSPALLCGLTMAEEEWDVSTENGICLGNMPPSVLIPGNLNADGYIPKVLQPIALSYLLELNNPIFQRCTFMVQTIYGYVFS